MPIVRSEIARLPVEAFISLICHTFKRTDARENRLKSVQFATTG